MKRARSRTLLDHALLGLLAQQPRSGYDLRKVFQETPMGYYSDSPGSIYPALRRLEQDGLVRTQAESSGRRRRACTLTPAGQAALEQWLRSDVTPHTIRTGEAELRLAFHSDVLGAADLRAYLARLAAASEAVVGGLERAESLLGHKFTRSGRIAFRFGIEIARTRRDYYRRAARAPRRKS